MLTQPQLGVNILSRTYAKFLPLPVPLEGRKTGREEAPINRSPRNGTCPPSFPGHDLSDLFLPIAVAKEILDSGTDSTTFSP